MPTILATTQQKSNTQPVDFLNALGMDPNRNLAIVLGTNQLYTGTVDGVHRSPKRNGFAPVGPEVPLASLNRLEEGGVFFRPNEIGHVNKTWQGSQCLFWEIDDQGFEEQQRRADWLASMGLAYKVKVFSGGKSFHYYIAIEYTTDSALWFQAMAMIAVLMESDPSIPMLNRLMRLPGFHRFKNGQWQEQRLDEVTDAPVYSIEQVIAILDATGRFPMGMDDRRFREWKRAVVLQKRKLSGESIPPDSPTPEEILSRDFDAWDAAKQAERIQRERERQQRRESVGADSIDPKDLINQANARLGTDAFTPYLEHQERGGKVRCLPLFRTGGGSYSAHLWQSGDGTWLYVDKGAGHACDGFRFYVWRMRGAEYSPRGGEFWDLLRDYCSLAGIEVPDFKSPSRFDDLLKEVVTTGPLAFLGTAVDRVLNRSPKRQVRESRAAIARAPRQPDRIFAPGERLAAIQEAQALGYTHILDSSITGSGKSHFAGGLQPSDLDAARVIYLSDEHRNPTTDTLLVWPDLESRHNGLRKEVQKDGSVRLRRAEGDGDLSVLPNCSRVLLIESLRSKGVGGADAAGTVCPGCPVREKCAIAIGDGFGYIHQRQVLKRPRFRAHPDSLPPDYDLSRTVVIWDEMGKSFAANTVTEITLDDFSITAEYLTANGHTAMAAELRIIRQVVQTLSQQRDVHGVGFEKFTEAFEGYQFGGLDPLRVDEAMDPDLAFLNPTAVHGVDVRDLPPALRKQMAGDGLSDAEAIPPQFYGNLLRVLQGTIPGGTCRINKQGKFELSVPNPHHRNIANGAQLTIALDATTTKADYALRVGTIPDKVYEIREQHAPMANLTIKQIVDIGYCGQQRGEDKQRRINAVIAAVQANGPAPVLDFKSQKKDGAWFVDTRGVNTWQHEDTLMLVGTPTANLGAAHAEWVALRGQYASMDSPDFQSYIQGKTDAELAQGIGRIRANRRGDEMLTLYLISSHNIRHLQAELGFNLEELEGADISIDAAPIATRQMHRILMCAQRLIESGKFCSQKVVAQLMGITEGRVSQIVKSYYGGWKKFVKAVKVMLFGEQMAEALDPEQSEIAQTLADMLTASLEDTESECAQLVAELLDGYGILYHHAVQRLTDQTRAYLAARLVLMT